MEKKIKLEFEDYTYHCGDGCCSEWGTIIKVNDKQLNYTGGQMEFGIEAVLIELGYEVEIEFK